MNLQSDSQALRCDIPTYYLCTYPLIELAIRRHTGHSLLSLIPNALLDSVPVFGIDLKATLPNPIKMEATKVFSEEQTLFTLHTTSAASLSEGLAALPMQIQEDGLVIATGTTYELPYSPDYRNPRFLERATLGGTLSAASDFVISDHTLAVTSYNKETVTVYDPIPHQFIGTLSHEAFAKFWQGNRQFEVFSQAKGAVYLVNYGRLEVKIAHAYHAIRFEHLLHEVLRRVSAAFLEGRTRTTAHRYYLSGAALNTYLRQFFVTYYAEHQELPRTLAKCLFDMRWSRYFLRDFICDLDTLALLPNPETKTEIDRIVQLWEQVYNNFYGMLRRSATALQAERFAKLLDEVIEREGLLHSKLYSSLLK